jgi:RNA polymerase sigma-70 factor (ECF subfamily)
MLEEPDWARSQRGDVEAFGRLYRENVARIYSLARRMAGDESAEDLTQEVFIRAWEKLGTFRGDANFSTWLHRLAVNWILSRREKEGRWNARRARGEGLFASARSPRRTPGLTVDFERAVERLPEGARRVFVLYDVEGYSHNEIAESMGISVGTSKSQLHRARMILRDHLS